MSCNFNWFMFCSESLIIKMSILITINILVHVVVATPGRILDLMKKKIADMSDCQMLVMDEVNLSFLSIVYNNSFKVCPKWKNLNHE